ncbi:MAG TPA: four helix bundle protein [Polyangiaceae bacterium]|jgi:four helix bundle protein|nr:four helix bundle protein [Polyangiaceae bacterium]
MTLDVENVSLELIAALKPLLPLIRKHDRSLADQLARAANSIALNIAEGAQSDAGNRRARYCTASGSANESRMALRVAAAWRRQNSGRSAAPGPNRSHALEVIAPFALSHLRAGMACPPVGQIAATPGVGSSAF